MFPIVSFQKFWTFVHTGWRQISEIMFDSTVTSVWLLVTFSDYWRLTKCGSFDKISFLSFWEHFEATIGCPLKIWIFTSTLFRALSSELVSLSGQQHLWGNRLWLDGARITHNFFSTHFERCWRWGSSQLTMMRIWCLQVQRTPPELA